MEGFRANIDIEITNCAILYEDRVRSPDVCLHSVEWYVPPKWSLALDAAACDSQPTPGGSAIWISRGRNGLFSDPRALKALNLMMMLESLARRLCQ